MNTRALFRLALAETRRSHGRLLFCVLSIALGVFALTAVRSVSSSVNSAFAGHARETLGADLVLSSNMPLEGNTLSTELGALEAQGARSAARVRFYSMLSRATGVSAAGTAKKQSGLVRVHAVSDGYPFYGVIRTEPERQFERLTDEPFVVADPRIVRQLGLRIGDTVRLGQWHAKLAGELRSEAGSPTADFSMAPPIYIHARFLPETQLIQTGSRVEYERLLQLPPELNAEDIKRRFEERLAGDRVGGSSRDPADDLAHDRVRVRTANEATSNVRRFLGRTARFMTVAGLVTLLLGALGIASALRAFMQDKLDHAAIFRCLGMTPRGVFRLYSSLAIVVAGVGSVSGALLGMALPLVLAPVLQQVGQGFLPADMRWTPSFGAALHGAAAGVVATLAFTLVPLLRTANVAPLRVLRRDVEQAPRSGVMARGFTFIGVFAGLGVVLALGILESDSFDVGLAFSVAVAVALIVLWALSRGLVRVARRVATRITGYAVRQGIANLHRPGNQTTSVVLAVGLGVMMLCTLLILQHSLQRAIAVDERTELPNLFIIDVQPDQTETVTRLVREAEIPEFELSPMIAARIAAVNRTSVADEGDNSANDREMSTQDDERDRSRARRREYFLSYRSEVLGSETIVAGTFWSGRPARQEASIDADLASTLDIELGDTLTLDIQGLPLDAVVTSLRDIHWESVRPNSMIVLSPGEIEQAPRMYIGAVRLQDEQQRYAFSDRLSGELPNLSVIDVTDAAKTVQQIVSRVSLVFNGLGALALMTGGIILAGAVASGRQARQRELTLLKVLGAQRRVLRRIAATEYLTLASLGAIVGYLLSEAFTRLLLGGLFGIPIVVPYAPVFTLLAATVAGNVVLGFVVGRTVGIARPLELLRDDV